MLELEYDKINNTYDNSANVVEIPMKSSAYQLMQLLKDELHSVTDSIDVHRHSFKTLYFVHIVFKSKKLKNNFINMWINNHPLRKQFPFNIYTHTNNLNKEIYNQHCNEVIRRTCKKTIKVLQNLNIKTDNSQPIDNLTNIFKDILRQTPIPKSKRVNETEDNAYLVLNRFSVNTKTETRCYTTMSSFKTGSQHNITCVSWNIGGKLSEKLAKGQALDNILKLERPSILALQETQCHLPRDSLSDNISKPAGYTLVSWGPAGESYRLQANDNKKGMKHERRKCGRRSGGVAIWVSDQVLKVLEPVVLFESSHLQILDLVDPETRTPILTIGNNYTPPTFHQFKTFFPKITNQLQTIRNRNLILLGDFNATPVEILEKVYTKKHKLKHIKVNRRIPTKITQDYKSRNQMLENLMHKFKLKCHNKQNQFTNFNKSSKSILDLVLANNDKTIKKITTIPLKQFDMNGIIKNHSQYHLPIKCQSTVSIRNPQASVSASYIINFNTIDSTKQPTISTQFDDSWNSICNIIESYNSDRNIVSAVYESICSINIITALKTYGIRRKIDGVIDPTLRWRSDHVISKGFDEMNVLIDKNDDVSASILRQKILSRISMLEQQATQSNLIASGRDQKYYWKHYNHFVKKQNVTSSKSPLKIYSKKDNILKPATTALGESAEILFNRSKFKSNISASSLLKSSAKSLVYHS